MSTTNQQQQKIHEAGDATDAIHRKLCAVLDDALAEVKAAHGVDEETLAAAAQTVCVLLASTYLVRAAIVRERSLDFLELNVPNFAEAVARVAIARCQKAVELLTAPPRLQ